jgi:uracil-DNA glycosylase
MFPHVKFDELYFTNLIKCRFKEKPGKNDRNTSKFLDDLAQNCYSRFLRDEMRIFSSSQYIFTLGRDTFAILADLLKVPHKPLTQFKELYGTALKISESPFGRACYLIPLPHQPTYDLANRYRVYGHDEVTRRLASLPLPA